MKGDEVKISAPNPQNCVSRSVHGLPLDGLDDGVCYPHLHLSGVFRGWGPWGGGGIAEDEVVRSEVEGTEGGNSTGDDGDSLDLQRERHRQQETRAQQQ